MAGSVADQVPAARWPGDPSFADQLLARCDFPPADGGPVALAVSGGPDSLALLILSRRAGLDCVAVHVDHGLRPGSAAEAEVVAAAAARLGAGVERRKVAVDPGPDLEARARRARYAALPAGVLTGHTMDDQAETVLLALMRGAGLDGLAGIRPRPANDLRPRRPLLALRRSETATLCRKAGLSPVDDPSNLDPRFRRNRVRHELLPLLADISGRDPVPVLARQASLLAADADLLESWSAGLDPTDARGLRSAPPPLARRAVRRWLRSDQADGDAESHPPSAAEVARVLEVAAGAVRACEIAGARRVSRHGGRLRVEDR